MANSYIDYKGRNVRINDQLLTVIVLMAKDVLADVADGQYIAPLVDAWVREALDAPPGLIALDLSGLWLSDRGAAMLRDLLKLIRQKVSSFGNVIPERYLEGLSGETNIQFVDTDAQLVLSALAQWESIVN